MACSSCTTSWWYQKPKQRGASNRLVVYDETHNRIQERKVGGGASVSTRWILAHAYSSAFSPPHLLIPVVLVSGVVCAYCSVLSPLASPSRFICADCCLTVFSNWKYSIAWRMADGGWLTATLVLPFPASPRPSVRPSLPPPSFVSLPAIPPPGRAHPKPNQPLFVAAWGSYASAWTLYSP